MARTKKAWVKPLTLDEVCNAGIKEGWILSYSDGTGTLNIEKDDDQDTFKDDRAALVYVREMALTGSVVHLFAMAFHENWEGE